MITSQNIVEENSNARNDILDVICQPFISDKHRSSGNHTKRLTYDYIIKLFKEGHPWITKEILKHHVKKVRKGISLKKEDNTKVNKGGNKKTKKDVEEQCNGVEVVKEIRYGRPIGSTDEKKRKMENIIKEQEMRVMDNFKEQIDILKCKGRERKKVFNKIIEEEKDKYLSSYDITKDYLLLNYKVKGLSESIVK